jgi:protein-glutamine gamma-glutamyltransferase
MNQIPRSALVLLLLLSLATLLIHVSHLPLLFWALAVLTAGWRWLMHLGRFPYPGPITKTLAVAMGVAAVYASFSGQFSLESAVAFFVTAALLKLLEMKTRRDAYILVYLQYFLLGAGFLFEQGPLWGAYGVLLLWLITVALVSLQFVTQPAPSPRVAMGYAGAMMLVALPMMLVVYLLFPRLGPLWSLSLQSDRTYTGLSGQMAPGDIADLSVSDELVFRVSFDEGELPERKDLYWRALVLDRYDGRTWRFSRNDRSVQWFPDPDAPRPGTAGVSRYEVIMEPNGKHWLYTLDNGAALEADIGITSTGVLVSRKPVFQRMHYQGVSLPEPRLRKLSREERQRNTELPANINPQSRSMATALVQQYPDAGGFSLALMRYFNEEAFHYTLKPPALGENDIDAFLFRSRRGFCAHYAGAFVFLARAAGFPARIVSGYQGGEWNGLDRFLTLRQYDAHAWAEIWQKGQGWVRVDPTAAVAPQRIEFGLEAALKEEESRLLASSGLVSRSFRDIGWLNSLRLEMESMNYLWNRWVLSYDGNLQKSLLQRFFSISDYQSMLSGMFAAVVGVFLLMGLLVFVRRPRQIHRPWIREWLRLQKSAEVMGVVSSPGDSARNWLLRLAQVFPPLADDCARLVKVIDLYVYQSQQISPDEERRLVRMTRALRRRLSRSGSAHPGSERSGPAAETAAASHVHERSI